MSYHRQSTFKSIKPQNILIVRPDVMGDVILMIPFIHTLKQNFPKAKITVMVRAYSADILQNHPFVDELIIDRYAGGQIRSIRDFWDYVTFIQNKQFDTVFFLYLEWFYALLCFFAKIPVRIGDGNKVLIRPFLTHAVNQSFRNLAKHEVEQNCDFIRAIKPDFVFDPTIQIALDPVCKKKAMRLLETAGLTKNQKFIGIHPSTGHGNRAWLPRKYARLIELIYLKSDYQVVLTGAGAKDEKVADEILSLCKVKPINLVNQTTLDELKWVIQKCAVFIGTDTGPTHLATALKVPILSISTTKFIKSLRWGPWQSLSYVITKSEECPYACNPFVCKRDNCLEAIKPFDVYRKLEKLLEQAQKNSVFDLKEARNEWFRASIRLGFYLDTSEPKTLESAWRLHQLLKKNLLLHYFICSSPQIAFLLQQKYFIVDDLIQVIPMTHPLALIRYINQKDISILHLFNPQIGSRRSFKPNFYWKMIQAFSALNMYVPPILIYKNDFLLTSTDMIETYLHSFR